MDYQAALDTIFNYVDYERRRSVSYDEQAWDLERTRRVLAALGNPHRGLRFVHVAGSKGKGSTAAMIESVLRASGQRTGFFTSPHLHTFRERIRVDGQLLAREELVTLLKHCQSAIEGVPGITTFEIITVLALVHFAWQQVDWAVLEVGLGGRLDATNVVTPALSVITPISLEHTALLGNTLAEIAREKAGIVKPGVPVICAPQPEEALRAISAICQQRDARLVQVGQDWQWTATADSLRGQVFTVADRRQQGEEGPVDPLPWQLSGVHLRLLGTHQLANATTAIAASWELAQLGVPITPSSLRSGLLATYWPGRLEVLQLPTRQQPALVVDSAHNQASAYLLRQALAGYFPGLSLRWVFGISSDKDWESVLEVLLPGSERLITTRSRHPRAVDAHDLARHVGARWPAQAVTASSSVAGAVEMALADAGPQTLVCVTGSLFVVAEAREAWLQLWPTGLPACDWAYQAEPPDPEWQVSQTRSSAL